MDISYKKHNDIVIIQRIWYAYSSDLKLTHKWKLYNSITVVLNNYTLGKIHSFCTSTYVIFTIVFSWLSVYTEYYFLLWLFII
jgi:hypothetical protein